MNNLDKINQEITQKQKERHNIIHSEMDKFKGKFFQNKKEGVIKISIFKVETKYWSNAIDYVRCFYCQDDYNSWWKIDEKLNFEYDEYNLFKLQEAEEISQGEYEKLRDVIIEQARQDEIDKIRIKYNGLKNND